VGIDEARHHDAVFRVDHLRVRRADVRLHRLYGLAFDQHVGLLEIADRAIERQHAAPLSRIGRPIFGFGAASASDVAPITLAAIAGAAAAVQRNCRRETP